MEHLERNGWVRIAITRIDNEHDIFITSKSLPTQAQRKFLKSYIENHDRNFFGSWDVVYLAPGGLKDDMLGTLPEEEG